MLVALRKFLDRGSALGLDDGAGAAWNHAAEERSPHAPIALSFTGIPIGSFEAPLIRRLRYVLDPIDHVQNATLARTP